jgi:hypothetical protein
MGNAPSAGRTLPADSSLRLRPQIDRFLAFQPETNCMEHPVNSNPSQNRLLQTLLRALVYPDEYKVVGYRSISQPFYARSSGPQLAYSISSYFHIFSSDVKTPGRCVGR